MPKWTESEEENQHLARILDEAFENMSTTTPTTVVLKDGTRLIGRVTPGATGNNKGQGVPERGWGIINFTDENGNRELDALEIETIFKTSH